MVIFLGGRVLISPNDKYLKIKSPSFQIADEKKSDVRSTYSVFIRLSCRRAALCKYIFYT